MASPPGGRGRPTLPLEEAEAPAAPTPRVDWLALDEALCRLAALDARQARIVDSRFVGGCRLRKSGGAADLSGAGQEQWSLARGWLYRELQGRMER